MSLDDSWGASAALFDSAFLWFIYATNSLHRWAHMEPARVPSVVKVLQRLHLVLPPEHHGIHHVAPYTKYYCITVGWMNEPLHRIGFFRILERVISRLTGLVPRADDIGVRAATALVDSAEGGQAPLVPAEADRQ
jgi:ubiquitin-conjugating enzyme E2 variant